jgi:hypothetical protein
MLEQQRLRSDGAHATWTDEFYKGDQQVDGENEDVAHAANRTMTANARKTAPHRQSPSYCEFATHTHWFLSLTDAQRKIEAWRQYFYEARPP